MTETPHADTSVPGMPAGARTAAQALADLDMPVYDAMMTQRSIRRVLPDPVEDAVVLKCIELALRAPTGNNGQNWEFIVVKDRRVKEKLAKKNRQLWNISYHTLIRRIAAHDESMAKTARAVQWQADHFTEIPVLVVACLRLGVLDGRVPFVRLPHAIESAYYGSIYPSVQNLLLAARAMGLGASMITLPLWRVGSARRALGLPHAVTPCCVVALGWPRGRYGPTTRKPLEQVLHLDTYGNQPWRDA